MMEIQNASRKSTCGPMLLITMAVIVVLGMLAFILFRSGGKGEGTESSPANTHSLVHHLDPSSIAPSA